MNESVNRNALGTVRQFSVQNRMVRLAWSIIWTLLASWNPPIFMEWRNFLLRCFGARVAPTARVYGSATIWLPSNLTLEAGSCIGPKVTCYCMDKIVIGRKAVISQGTHLCAGSHDLKDPYFATITKPIIIDEGAWVCAEAFVGPGVRIGRYAVLGARGVAFSDLEPFGIYAGNPAVKIKDRGVSHDFERK